MINSKIIRYAVIATLIILTLIVIGSIFKHYEKEQEYNNMILDSMTEGIGILDGQPVEVENPSSYYTVLGCVEKYTGYIYEKENEKLYNILNKDYVQKNGITKANIIEKLGEFNAPQIIRVKKMVEIRENEKQSRYFIYATIRDDYIGEQENGLDSNTYQEVNEVRQPEREFLIEVKLDFVNSTYEIIPNHSRFNDEISLKDYTPIEVNSNNIYEDITIDEETMCIYLLEDFKEKVLYYPEEAYNSLDEEYKAKRFPTFDEFREYIENNKEEIDNAIIKQYYVDAVQGDNRYICTDGEDNYFIFKTTAVMNYKIMLDIYNIPLKESVEAYSNSTDTEKVKMNVNKWIMAANNKDYGYMYRVLSEEFKQSNNITKESLANYAANQFYYKNTIDFGEYTEEENSKKIQIKILNAYNIEQNFVMNITMNLNEDNGFDMSFEVL